MGVQAAVASLQETQTSIRSSLGRQSTRRLQAMNIKTFLYVAVLAGLQSQAYCSTNIMIALQAKPSPPANSTNVTLNVNAGQVAKFIYASAGANIAVTVQGILFHGQFRKHSFRVVVGLLGHHVPGRLGQLAAQRLGRDDPAGLGLMPSGYS
jgi:hypothetical protein